MSVQEAIISTSDWIMAIEKLIDSSAVTFYMTYIYSASLWTMFVIILSTYMQFQIFLLSCFKGSVLEKAGGDEFKEEVKKLSESHGTLELAAGQFFFGQYCAQLHRGAVMFCALAPRSSRLGLSRGQRHCLAFKSKTLYSHSASLHPGV